MFGNPSQYLKQIANTESATYYIDGSEINIVAAPDIAEDEIVDLSPETGLINSPTQIQYGISCTCLINPRLKLNSLFHIDNSRVINEEQEIGAAYRSLDGNGIYRIVKMVYTGDTRGNDWEIDIEAISQAGILPSMVSGASSFMWG